MIPNLIPPPVVSWCLDLRASGVSWSRIASMVRVPLATLLEAFEGPQWPKVVARVDVDGRSGWVRFP